MINFIFVIFKSAGRAGGRKGKGGWWWCVRYKYYFERREWGYKTKDIFRLLGKNKITKFLGLETQDRVTLIFYFFVKN